MNRPYIKAPEGCICIPPVLFISLRRFGSRQDISLQPYFKLPQRDFFVLDKPYGLSAAAATVVAAAVVGGVGAEAAAAAAYEDEY